jgi:hypothetical protein
MSDIIVPGGEEKKPEYEGTEEDEENFLLMYFLKMSFSDIKSLSREQRHWYIGRYMGQKQMEQEMMAQARMQQQIMPNLRA